MSKEVAIAAVARNVAADMRRMELKCWKGQRMGTGAVALMLDGFASRLEGAYNRSPGNEGEMSDALRHCGYEAEEFEEGTFTMGLTTPYEGATIEAAMFSKSASGLEWAFNCHVSNNRGTGWSIDGTFHDCGRYVAKSMLRSMALELRKAYTHRGQKIRKRAIARAKAKLDPRDTPLCDVPPMVKGDATNETKTL